MVKDNGIQYNYVHPDSWIKGSDQINIGQWEDYKSVLLEKISPKILPPGELRPRFALITLSKAGTCLLYRTEAGGVDGELIPPVQLADEIVSRQGAGDILRAAFIKKLLLYGCTTEKDDHFFGLDKEKIVDAIGIAQCAVYLWLTRSPGSDYFSGFEQDFSEIEHKYREQARNYKDGRARVS